MNTVLHIVNRSQRELESCQRLVEIVSATDAVLLIENAVYHAVSTPANMQMMNRIPASVYVLGPDLEARGLTAESIMDNITEVDYEGFADLSAEYGVSVSW